MVLGHGYTTAMQERPIIPIIFHALFLDGIEIYKRFFVKKYYSVKLSFKSVLFFYFLYEASCATQG